MVTFVGASIAHDEPLILRSDGKVQIERIGDFVDRYFAPKAEGSVYVSGTEVVAFSPDTFEVDWRPVQYLYRHRRHGKLLSFELQTGRRSVVTPDHSLFVLRDGAIRAEPASEIRSGDFVVGSKTIPCSTGGEVAVNLLDLLPNVRPMRGFKLKRFEDYYVYDVPEEAFVRIDDGRERRWKDWKHNRILPIRYASMLTRGEMDNVTVGCHGRATHLRPLVDVDEELARLLGYYTAGGHIMKRSRLGYRVEFTFGTQDEEIINDTISILKRKFGSYAITRRHSEKAVRVSTSHRILCELFERLVGTGASRNRVPSVILNSPPSIRRAFFVAWVKGDCGVTVSEQLANDVSYLLLMDNCMSAFRVSEELSARFTGRSIVGRRAFRLRFPRPERVLSDPDWGKRKRYKDEPTLPASALPDRLRYFYRTTATLRNPNGRLTDRVLQRLESRLTTVEVLSGTSTTDRRENQEDGTHRNNLKFFIKKDGKIYPGSELRKAIYELGQAKRLARSDLAFLRVVSIEEVESQSEYVYDVSVPGCENFLASFGGVFCHNSGCGKTTLARIVAKGLEKANGTGEFPNSFIYVDVKGDDAWKFLSQADNLDPAKITFLDPNSTGFSLNPFELPPHDDEDAERVRSVYTGFVMKIIEEWYGADPVRAPRMLRIFRVLISYLYTLTDAPTFVDLHDLVIALQSGDESALTLMRDVLDRVEFDSLRKELEAIADMRSEAFDPVLTRLSEFAVDPYLRRLFGAVRRSSIDFAELLKPGRQTIIRIPSHEVGLHVGPLIQSVVLLKLWFAVLWRATRLPERDRTPVVLFLDEFQDLQRLQAIQTILVQARSQGLCLMLSHQTIAQLDDTLLRIIVTNASIQGAGRVSGDDAARLARSWDLQYRKEVEQALVTQPDFTWTFRLRAGPGEEQSPPVQDRLLQPPHEHHSKEEIQAFLARMRELYGADRTEGSVFDQRREKKPEWMALVPPNQPVPSREEWRLLVTVEAPPRLQTPVH
jgi:intein/homing endonuclease